MNLIFDNNLAPKLAHALNALVEPDHKIIHLKDRFVSNVEDEEWMGALARETRWVVVTADVRIGRNPHEVAAWKEAGHTVFFLKPGWTDLKFWEQATKLTKILPEIISAAERAKAGAGFFVSVKGKIEAIR